MRLSPIPDLTANRRLVLVALAVTVVAAVALLSQAQPLSHTLGDTDDAMRLMMVRDLMAGRGWYDQWIGRLQPPLGLYMHWSRLVDGGLAAMTWAFRTVLSPAAAETATRTLWPLLWIAPAVAAALLIARRLAGAPAVFVCAILMVCDLQMFLQFRPGRIDHHNVQIVMTLVAIVCATASRNRPLWALGAGVASGLGLAVGIEALPFHAVIGAAYGLRTALDREDAGAGRSYALALVGATLLFYGLQTPPWRWSMAFCDGIGLNLVAAVTLAGAGLAAIASWRSRVSARAALLALSVTGVVAAGAYLAIMPACIQGPVAAIDPSVRPFWFDRVAEMASWKVLLKSQISVALQVILVAAAVLAACGVLVAREWRRPRPVTLIAVGIAALAVAAESGAVRMQSYVFWIGIPVLSAAYGLVATRFIRGLMLPTAAASAAFSPVAFIGVSHVADGAFLAPPARPEPRSSAAGGPCGDPTAYSTLAALGPGLVVADVDLGPYILATTSDSVMAAPYRGSWGILKAHQALVASPAAAQPMFRALKAQYLVDCPALGPLADANGLQAQLRRGQVPEWLQPLSAKTAAVQVYRVRAQEPQQGS